MKKKMFVSMLVILVAIVATVGGTMAWFTDSVELNNTFTAGTLSIGGADTWKGLAGEDWKNVNPGDCKDKEFTITNDGTKNALLRFKWNGEWSGVKDPVTGEAMVGDLSLVTVTAPVGWHEHTDGYWYYTAGPLAPDPTKPLKFALNVCIKGKETGNAYQGASFKLDFTFEAIQASNNASGDLWTVNSLYYLNGVPTLMVNPATENMTADNWAEFGF